MIRKRLIPTLLLKNDGLYKTTNFQDPVYLGDPINVVKIFNDKFADELCILDITSREKNHRINFDILESICSEAFMPVTYGGGVNNIEDVKRLFSTGVEKIILNSILYRDLDILKESAKIFGSQSIVVGLDFRKSLFGKYHLYSGCGKIKEKVSPEKHIESLISIGFGEMIVTSIDREGSMKGLDIELLNMSWLNISSPIIATGGIGSWEHIENGFSSTNISGIGIGSYFVYYGREKGILITYPEENKIDKL